MILISARCVVVGTSTLSQTRCSYLAKQVQGDDWIAHIYAMYHVHICMFTDSACVLQGHTYPEALGLLVTLESAAKWNEGVHAVYVDLSISAYPTPLVHQFPQCVCVCECEIALRPYMVTKCTLRTGPCWYVTTCSVWRTLFSK